MHELLEKILETTILLIILWCNGTSGQSSSAERQSLALRHHWNRGKFARATTSSAYGLAAHSANSPHERSDEQSRTYYSSVPATPFIPAFDPISVLASLAFLAFLMQSFAALFDRTRSIIPTIVSSRRSSSEYGEQFIDIEKRVLRALEEYASLSNDLLDNEKESEKSVS